MLGHQKTSEEALGASESTTAVAAPTMAPGAPSREETSLARVGGTSPHARENAPEGAQVQEPLRGKQQQQQRPGSADAFGSTQNDTVVPAPEDVPPDAENIEENSRILVETERCPEPRTAKSRKRTRRSRGSEEGIHVTGWGPVRRLLWRTGPRPARARHKAIESWKLDA